MTRPAPNSPTSFTYADCAAVKSISTQGGTGYAVTNDGSKICYACCAVRDRANMIRTGKATLYLTMSSSCDVPGQLVPAREHVAVSNWSDTLRFPIHTPIKRGKHNIAGIRYDVWFTGPDGEPWHGVTYGRNTQICHCRRIKS